MPQTTSENSPPHPEAPDQFNCGGCPQTDQCRKVWSMPRRGPLGPAGLSLGSAVVFLLPLALAAVAGAAAGILTSRTQNTLFWQAAAATAGLIIGAVLAWRLMPIIRKRFHEPKP